MSQVQNRCITSLTTKKPEDLSYEEWCQFSLAICEKVFGKDHPCTVQSSYTNVAEFVMQAMGDTVGAL